MCLNAELGNGERSKIQKKAVFVVSKYWRLQK